jgi:hypothetical protein
MVHLLPRPLAVALHWCHTPSVPSIRQEKEGKEDKRIGRLRVVTMALDVWEVVSLELHAHRYEGRTWIVPMRDRTQPTDAPLELQALGLGFALALAYADVNGESLEWWHRVFASDWLEKRLVANHNLSPQELQAIQEVRSSNLLASLRREFAQLAAHQPLWSHLFQSGPALRNAIRHGWESQERHLGIGVLPCAGILADGAFAELLIKRISTVGERAMSPTLGATLHVSSPGQPIAVKGAALAAAAIAYGLPCYRETLLPLDLYVRSIDEYGDPAPQWKELVAVRSVEAGRLWRSPNPVTGLQIQKDQNRLLIPLRRTLCDKAMFRQVGTEFATAAKHDEPVRVEVEVKPGQGFARVRIESVTPGVFAARLDWSTMEECDEPALLPLAYLPGVSRIVPDEQMFNDARPALTAALRVLRQNSSDAKEPLDDVVNLLNKWPLAHNVERARGRTVAEDFMLHFSVIGSDGDLDKLRDPDLARNLQHAIGEKFYELVQQRKDRTPLANTLLRAGGWFYLAMPQECFMYLRQRLAVAKNHPSLRLSPTELGAIGLAFESLDDLRQFYLLAVRALRAPRPNNWLRAIRNICRLRNHALHPDAISDTHLVQLTAQLFATLREQAEQRNFGQIFRNCLEALLFLLKRRRYDPEFLAPTSQLAQDLIHCLEKVDHESRWRLPQKLKPVPQAAINFLQRQATESDIEALLSMADEDDSDA